MFSHHSDEYVTPKWLFDKLNEKYHFTLDPCATHQNHQCDKYYTVEDNGLSKSWLGERVFINPPYSNVGVWIRKAYEENQRHEVGNPICILLIPARVDTRWFHEYCMEADEIGFIKGRLKFDNPSLPSWKPDGSHKVSPAPFPSMVVSFYHKFSLPCDPGGPVIYTITRD